MVFAQAGPSVEQKWKTQSIPKFGHAKLIYAEHFQFVVPGGSLVMISNAANVKAGDKMPFEFNASAFREQMTMTGKKSVIKTNDGFLVAFNNAELGGRLYWFSEDGKEMYNVSKRTVLQFIVRDDRLYAIEGFAHMGTDKGSILSISCKAGRWVAKEYSNLPSSPVAIRLDLNNNFVVKTSAALRSIDRNTNITILDEQQIAGWGDGF